MGQEVEKDFMKEEKLSKNCGKGMLSVIPLNRFII
jgi:hypothetical protein